MPRPQHVVVRGMAPAEMQYIEDWARREGWNPGVNDLACFRGLEGSAFFLAEADGAPAGCIGAVNFGDQLSIVGALIVQPEFRGGIVGRRLARRALEHAGGGRTVACDAVASAARAYMAGGLRPVYEIVRCRLAARPGGRADGVVDLTGRPFAEVEAYDRRLFPAGRAALMSRWIRQEPAGCALGVLDRGVLAGYGVMRAAFHGFRLEPLYADSPELGERLFSALLARVPAGSPVYLNVPLAHEGARALLRGQDTETVFTMVRMSTRPLPDHGALGRTYSELV